VAATGSPGELGISCGFSWAIANACVQSTRTVDKTQIFRWLITAEEDP
jgi:hypothetical protein